MVPSPQPLAHSASPAKPRQQPGAFPQDRLQGQDFPPDALALPQPPAPVSSAPSSWHPGSPTAAPTVSPGLTPSSQGAGGQSLGPSQSPPSPVKGTHTHTHTPPKPLPSSPRAAGSERAGRGSSRSGGRCQPRGRGTLSPSGYTLAQPAALPPTSWQGLCASWWGWRVITEQSAQLARWPLPNSWVQGQRERRGGGEDPADCYTEEAVASLAHKDGFHLSSPHREAASNSSCGPHTPKSPCGHFTREHLVAHPAEHPGEAGLICSEALQSPNQGC